MNIASRALFSLAHRVKSYRSFGLDRLDRKVVKHLPRKVGVFLEVGANDGKRQSNTLYLEKYRGWTGILVEPIPHLAVECARFRTRSRTFNCACTDPETAQRGTVQMTDCNLMSVVTGALGDPHREAEWIGRGQRLQRITAETVEVPCRTLSSIITECGEPHIDFLSLDVEGYEIQVLRGLDLHRHRPTYLLTEVLLTPLADLRSYLKPWYDLVAEFSEKDVLFRARATEGSQ